MSLTAEQLARIDFLLYECEDCETFAKTLTRVESSTELHALAQQMNWDGGFDELNAVLEHPLCDRGTALMIYWLGEPTSFENLKSDDEVPAVNQAIAAIWMWPRSVPWAGPVPQAAPYPSLNQDSQPSLVRTSQLPALVGYLSPKPVVAADDQGHVVVVAYGTTDSPFGSDILAWRSADRGDSWGAPKNLTENAINREINFDPWLETDGHGDYYLVYVLGSDGRPLIRRSKDAAKTWSDSLPIPWKSCDRPVLGISPDGKQLVVAGAMSELAANAPAQPLNGNDPDLAKKVRAAVRFSAGVFVSDNHGDSWVKWTSPFGDDEHAIPFAAVVDDSRRVAVSWIIEGNGSRSAVSVTEDRGRTWMTTTLIDSLQPDRPHPFNGERFPVLAVDQGGSLHVAYVIAGAADKRRTIACTGAGG